MTFNEVVIECCKNKELVFQFNRLQGTSLSFIDTRQPIERMIDDAIGNPNIFSNKHDEMIKWFNFIFGYIWLPLLTAKEETE